MLSCSHFLRLGNPTEVRWYLYRSWANDENVTLQTRRELYSFGSNSHLRWRIGSIKGFRTSENSGSIYPNIPSRTFNYAFTHMNSACAVTRNVRALCDPSISREWDRIFQAVKSETTFAIQDRFWNFPRNFLKHISNRWFSEAILVFCYLSNKPRPILKSELIQYLTNQNTSKNEYI